MKKVIEISIQDDSIVIRPDDMSKLGSVYDTMKYRVLMGYADIFVMNGIVIKNRIDPNTTGKYRYG